MSRDNALIPLYDGLRFPGEGMADRSYPEPLSPWGRMARGQALGKKVNLVYRSDDTHAQFAPTSVLELRGDDLDACQLMITLNTPAAIPGVFADLPTDVQNATGEYTNREIAASDYPGTGAAIIWPPFVAIVKWGTGGARAVAAVDFVNGACVNVPCSSVDLSVAVSPDAINAPGTSGIYTLSAFVTPGRPSPGHSSQRTINLGEIANGAESAVWPVPAFAHNVTLVQCDPSAGIPAVTVGYIRFFQGGGGQLGTCIGNYLVTGNQPGPFKVPNGAASFTVTSGGAPTSRFAAIFGLSL